MKTMTNVLLAAPLLAGLAMIGCKAQEPGGIVLGGGDGQIGNKEGGDDPTQHSGTQTPAAGRDNTFDHMSDLSENGAKDPFEVLAQRQEEGEPEIRTRLHSCQKLRITTLANMLAAFGVNLKAAGNPMPAGQLLASGKDALGAANFASRSGEALTWSNSGATKLHDIFVQAAPEIIAAMPNLEQCKVNGQGTSMFDDNDHCNPDAVSCLMGKPATPEHVAVCNAAALASNDVNKGKAIAVASILSAAHACE